MRSFFYSCVIFIFCNCSFAQQTSLIDSLIFLIQQKPIDISIINRSFQIPYDHIVNNLNKCLLIYEKIISSKAEKDPVRLGDLKEKLALVYYLKGNYTNSFNLHKETILLFDQSKDLKRKAQAMANMAYESKKRNLKSSIELMREALTILKKLNNPGDLSGAVNNFGVLFEMNNELDSALYYYNEAFKLNLMAHDSVGMPYSLNNIAGVFFLKKNIKEGLKYINRSTIIRNNLKDHIGMAWNEYTLGEVFNSEGNSKEALLHFRTSLNYAQQNSYPDLIGRNMKYIASIMSKQKKYDSAFYYFNSFYNIHDSLYNSQAQKQLLEMESIYENEKKSSQINSLNSENQLKEKELEKKRVFQVFLVVIIFCAFVILVFIFRAYKQKKKTNEVLSHQKLEIEKQKHIVDEKQKEIIDSINYAKKIQSAIITNQNFIDQNIADNFVLFNPKDIVSGDFYWATKKEHLFYLAICDSTGHGVPGAFMSLLNIGFLSEAINEKDILKPNEIFDHVRSRLVSSMSKEGQKDGFDGILVCFNTLNEHVTYAAANNAPIIIRDNKIIERTKDKMPVGVGERQEKFSLFELDSKRGDAIYFYTDGYADQFGGPKGKKFKYKPLNNLLLSLHSIPLQEQKVILQNKFIEWKGNLEQVDDVCIIGIRL